MGKALGKALGGLQEGFDAFESDIEGWQSIGMISHPACLTSNRGRRQRGGGFGGSLGWAAAELARKRQRGNAFGVGAKEARAKEDGQLRKLTREEVSL